MGWEMEKEPAWAVTKCCIDEGVFVETHLRDNVHERASGNRDALFFILAAMSWRFLSSDTGLPGRGHSA